MSRLACALLLTAVACNGNNNNVDFGACTTIDGQCLYPPTLPAARTQCGDVTEFCDKTAVTTPKLDCLTTPKVPGAGPAMVTLTGFVRVFSSGPDARNLSVAIYDAAPLVAGADITTATPITTIASLSLDPATQRACDADGKYGCSIPSQTGCAVPVCGDGLNGHPDNKKYCRDDGGGNFVCSDCLRWEARYTMPAMVPTNKQLVARVTGANGMADSTWANLVSWNIFLSTSDHACTNLGDVDCIDVASTTYQYNVNALSQSDYVNIPVTSGLSGGITKGKGAVAGEVHDCDNIRIEQAVVGVLPKADRFTYFNGNPIKTIPDSSRSATDRLGLYAGLNVTPGSAKVVTAGLVNGVLTSIGSFDAIVYPDTVSVLNINGGHPK